ncbi:hypothetical protein AMAG_12736 [Allomyces macrogynus ATCC 38327]|uniref:Uncharacterized protein n=1 Tax=Allomyces macrogynus (strain ATCC 38327) TaxID=578462 RepID=A0A0L0T1D9_ALLM3|nr:hypothetical protein AMAG_12736 [Allomyces macrogynus ATCC 38327]|eukprot:KNE68566.1 hypothetical protein AMAG_12736 [Allomyces macrogynus ATCC 38327]
MANPSPATPYRRRRACSIPANCTDDDNGRALITFNLALNDAEESCHVCRAAATHALAIHPRLLDAAGPTLGRGLATPGAGALALDRDDQVAPSTLPATSIPDPADAGSAPPACSACETRRWRRAHATLDDTSRRLADWHKRVIATDPTGQAGPRKPVHRSRTRSRTESTSSTHVIHHLTPQRGAPREIDTAGRGRHVLPPHDASAAAGTKLSMADHSVDAGRMLIEE